MGNRETALENLEGAKRTGRPKGSRNKFTTLQDSFFRVYEYIGGDKKLAEFAKKNPKEFYQMVSKMLPRNIKGEIKGDAYEGATALAVQVMMAAFQAGDLSSLPKGDEIIDVPELTEDIE